MEVLIEAARVAIARFEGFKCVNTFDGMVDAVSKCSGISKKNARARLEKKYGRLYSKESI
jgi:hypothetical protein